MINLFYKNGKRNDQIYKYLQSPHKIKQAEQHRLNPSFVNIKYIHKLQPHITYLWVIDKFGDVNLGIEKPWLYPEAFGLSKDSTLWKSIASKLKTTGDGKYGHPSLAPLYNKQGKIITSTSTPCAFGGGELYFKNNKWIINNISGRFGKIPDTDYNSQLLLFYVAERLNSQINHPTEIRLRAQQPYLKSYYKHWDKGKTNLDKAIALIEDFAYGSNFASKYKLFFKQREKQSIRIAKQLIKKVRNKEITSVTPLLSYLYSHLKHGMDPSLKKRVRFICGQLGLKLELKLRQVEDIKDGNPRIQKQLNL